MEHHEKLWDTTQDWSFYMAVKHGRSLKPTNENCFQWQCLRRILRIRWQQRITNKRVVEMAEVNDISREVRRRRWNWLGHILRREGSNDCFTALGWIPEVRRARGRPKTTWRRTVEKEKNKAGWKSWEVAKAVARNRECWSESVMALCAYWRNKN